MATITLGIDTRSIKNGMCTIRMRINHKSTASYINTGVSVEPDLFIGDLYNPIKNTAYMYQSKVVKLRDWVMRFEKALLNIDEDDSLNIDSMTANDIRAYIIGERAHKPARVRDTHTHNRTDFLEWFSTYGMSKENENTRKHYGYVYRLLNLYCNDRGMKTLYIDEIDYNILSDIREWVLTSRTDVTRYKVESYMHSAYVEAQRKKMVNRDNDPYEDYTIKRVHTDDSEIDVIELEDLRRFLSMDLTNQQGYEGLSRARDILWASFCMCGANLIDLYHMPKQIGNEVVYIRHKNLGRTRRPVHTQIVDDIDYIVERYAGQQYMFNFQERHANYYTFQRRINERCERLSRLLGAKVNMQLIRRTWATIAGMEAVDWHIVNKSLGHIDKEVTDKNYQRFFWQRAAEANQRVIDFVMQGVEPNSVKVPKIFRAA